MTDEKKPPPGMWSNLFIEPDPNSPKLPYKTVRKKRRRKGQLNDGEWAPGYGPNAKGKPKP